MKKIYTTKMPYRFRHGIIDFWGPGDASDGHGPGSTSGDTGAGVGGDSGGSSGSAGDSGGVGPSSGPEGLGDGMGHATDGSVAGQSPGSSGESSGASVGGLLGMVVGAIANTPNPVGMVTGAISGYKTGESVQGFVTSLSADSSPTNVSNTLGVDATTAQSISDGLSGMSGGEIDDVFQQAQAIIETGEAEARGLPESVIPGLDQFVESTQTATDAYNQKAQALWDDYLTFEQQYFDKYDQTLNQYNEDIASIPQINFKMPDSMGGAITPMAPKQHSSMYNNQAATRQGLIQSQANTALAGLTNRTGVSQNQYGVNTTQAQNALLPTNTALDLYKMERAGELGLQQVAAGTADSPSAWSTWAPVVGGLLSTDDNGTSAVDELISVIGGFF